MSLYDTLAQLPLKIESYELEDNDREYSAEFTRGSTIIRLRGDGQEGIGEDVVYDGSRPHRPPRRRARQRLHRRLHPRRVLRAGRRARLLRAGRAASTPPRATTAAGRTSRPRSTSRCARARRPVARGRRTRPEAAHVRLLDPARRRWATTASSTRARSRSRDRLAQYPTLEFKLDPENDWDADLIEAIERAGDRARRRPQGPLPRDAGRRRHRSRALCGGRRGVPGGLPRGPGPERGDQRGPRAPTTTGSPGTPTSIPWTT